MTNRGQNAACHRLNNRQARIPSGDAAVTSFKPRHSLPVQQYRDQEGPFTIRIKPAQFSTNTRERLAPLRDPQKAQKLRICPHLYRTLLERRATRGHRPVPANIVATRRNGDGGGGLRVDDNNQKKPCLLTVAEWEQLRQKYLSRMSDSPPKQVEMLNTGTLAQRIADSKTTDSSVSRSECEESALRILPAGRSRRPPSKRERKKQSEYRLKRWTESTDEISTSTEEANPFLPQETAEKYQSSGKQTRGEGRARAMSNMTKILAAINATSPTDLAAKNPKLEEKRAMLKTTDSGVWCDGAIDGETQAGPRPVRIETAPEPRSFESLKGARYQRSSPNVKSSVPREGLPNNSQTSRRGLINAVDGKSNNSASKGGSVLANPSKPLIAETSGVRFVPVVVNPNLPTGCEVYREDSVIQQSLPTDQRDPETCLDRCRRSRHFENYHEIKDNREEEGQYYDNCETPSDDFSIRYYCDNHTVSETCSDSFLSADPSNVSIPVHSPLAIREGPGPSILKRPNTVYVNGQQARTCDVPALDGVRPGTWTYMCGCCEPPQQQILVVKDGAVLPKAPTQLPVIYECVCAECTSRSTNSGPRYYQLAPAENKTAKHQQQPQQKTIVPSRATAAARAGGRLSRHSQRGGKHVRGHSMRSLDSTFSSKSRLVAFLQCFNCFDEDSETLSSGGSDSDNDDGNDGGDESEGYEEHGDGVSIDEDSDGGDSGSESGGDVSLNSAELFDDQNNMFDIKNAMGEGEESDGAPNSGGSDSDSLTELRSRSKKGSGTSDDEEDSDDYELDDDDDFDDSWDSVAMYERE